MPYQVEWYMPGHIIYQQMSAVVTVQDVEAASADAQALQQTVSRGFVHFLVDLRQMTTMNFSLNDLRQAQVGQKSDTTGWTVFVSGHNPVVVGFMKFVTVAIGQMFKVRVRLFTEMAAALEFLAEMDDAVAEQISTRVMPG